MSFIEELRRQRWDDHRFYHHDRINQTLHLISAICFLTSYITIFFNPVLAVMVGWLLAMILRQIGHFFFEPKTYDKVNKATHQHKESVKVGYNLFRKVVLLSIWILAPLVFVVDASFFGLLTPANSYYEFTSNISYVWFFIGIGAVLFRTVQLFFIMGFQSGIAWFTKILTDPFHDIYIYHKAPYYLLKGEHYDDMSEWYIPEYVAENK